MANRMLAKKVRQKVSAASDQHLPWATIRKVMSKGAPGETYIGDAFVAWVDGGDWRLLPATELEAVAAAPVHSYGGVPVMTVLIGMQAPSLTPLIEAIAALPVDYSQAEYPQGKDPLHALAREQNLESYISVAENNPHLLKECADSLLAHWCFGASQREAYLKGQADKELIEALTVTMKGGARLRGITIKGREVELFLTSAGLPKTASWIQAERLNDVARKGLSDLGLTEDDLQPVPKTNYFGI